MPAATKLKGVKTTIKIDVFGEQSWVKNSLRLTGKSEVKYPQVKTAVTALQETEKGPVILNATFGLPMLDMCKKKFDFFYRITVEIWSHFTPLQWRPHNPKKHPRPTYNTVPTTETIHELILYALSDGR